MKIRDWFEKQFPKTMSRGQQSAADYLARNGWIEQEPQQGTPVYKSPLTGDNFLEDEALRRVEQCPFEDRAIVILGRVTTDAEKARGGNAQLMTEVRELNQEKQKLDLRIAELVEENNTLRATKNPAPAAPVPPAPAPTAAPAKTAGS